MPTFDETVTLQSLFAENTSFGERIATQHDAKCMVANKVVDDLLWPHRVDTLYVGDGSSSAEVWFAYANKWLHQPPNSRLMLYTNNHAVLSHCLADSRVAKAQIRVFSAPGELVTKYGGYLGEDTEEWVSRYCRRGVSILAVTGLDAGLGPISHDRYARTVKMAVLESASSLIVVADASKLSNDPDSMHAANPARWGEWVKNRRSNLWVVTTLDSEIHDGLRIIEDAKSPLEFQEHNARTLRDRLQDHFVIAGR